MATSFGSIVIVWILIATSNAIKQEFSKSSLTEQRFRRDAGQLKAKEISAGEILSNSVKADKIYADRIRAKNIRAKYIRVSKRRGQSPNIDDDETVKLDGMLPPDVNSPIQGNTGQVFPNNENTETLPPDVNNPVSSIQSTTSQLLTTTFANNEMPQANNDPFVVNPRPTLPPEIGMSLELAENRPALPTPTLPPGTGDDGNSGLLKSKYINSKHINTGYIKANRVKADAIRASVVKTGTIRVKSNRENPSDRRMLMESTPLLSKSQIDIDKVQYPTTTYKQPTSASKQPTSTNSVDITSPIITRRKSSKSRRRRRRKKTRRPSERQSRLENLQGGKLFTTTPPNIPALENQPPPFVFNGNSNGMNNALLLDEEDNGFNPHQLSSKLDFFQFLGMSDDYVKSRQTETQNNNRRHLFVNSKKNNNPNRFVKARLQK